MNWNSPSGILKSPLQHSSPNISERVTSPVTNASTHTPLNFLSPSKGAGIGSVWSAALDEQLKKSGSEPSSKASNSKEVGKENLIGSQFSKTDMGNSSVIKPTKTIVEREVLSPELVKKF